MTTPADPAVARRHRAAQVVLAMLADDLRRGGKVRLDDPRLLESVLATRSAEVDRIVQFAEAEVRQEQEQERRELIAELEAEISTIIERGRDCTPVSTLQMVLGLLRARQAGEK